MQTIPSPPLVVDNAAYQMVNVQWVNFPDFVLTNVIHAVEPHACTDEYMEWFRRVSHPYIIRRQDQRHRPLSPPRRHRRSDDEDEPPSMSQQHDHACPVLYYVDII